MKIGLLGMSGVGKTFWATQLAAVGFECWHCDDFIASKLQRDVDQPLNTLSDVGQWMGFPYEPGFHKRENQYLSAEYETLVSIATRLAHSASDHTALVVDMTGSAIYAPEQVLVNLKRSLVLVYLALTPQVHQEMLEAYLQQPRPLIWRGLFLQEPGDTLAMSFRESYARLIAHRETLYEKFCAVKIEYGAHRQLGFAAQDFLQTIRTALPM